jgi:hypothetical protein
MENVVIIEKSARNNFGHITAHIGNILNNITSTNTDYYDLSSSDDQEDYKYLLINAIINLKTLLETTIEIKENNITTAEEFFHNLINCIHVFLSEFFLQYNRNVPNELSGELDQFKKYINEELEKKSEESILVQKIRNKLESQTAN